MSVASKQKLDQDQLQDLVAQSDTGARNPKGLAGRVLVFIALAWAIFQVYYASPMAFWLNDLFGINLTIDDTRARSIHLAFAVFLSFTAYPAYLHKLNYLKRFTAILLLGLGIILTYMQIGYYKELTGLINANNVVTTSDHALFLAYIGFACVILGNPFISRFWSGANQFISTVVFVVGLILISCWAYNFAGLESLVTKAGDTVRNFQLQMALSVLGITFLVLAFPAFEQPSRRKISFPDWLLALVAAFCALYTFIYYQELANRQGLPSTFDVVASAMGMALLLEATRRALGPPLVIVGLVFLSYCFLAPYMPDVIANKAYSLQRVVGQQWITTQGVFGIALGVSTKFVFLFVLFGALLDRAGAGNYFIKIAISLLGHLRGGPAKAAVAASGMTGLISGSSIANVVTTGTFTVPLMKRVGFTGEKAGAIEVSSSVNGQLMPPVMGAAAFLMIEYVGIPYLDVIKHAFLPAVISYIALIYIVHLEALKEDMQAIPKQSTLTGKQKLIRWGIGLTSMIIFIGFATFIFSTINLLLPKQWATFTLLGIVFLLMVLSIYKASQQDDLEEDNPDKPIVELPKFSDIIYSGLYFFIPIAILVWSLMIERLSPGRSAFWAIMTMMLIILIQDVLFSYFRKEHQYKAAFKKGLRNLYEGMIAGSRNMIGIGVATAAAGVVVGTVSLTGIGDKLTALIELLSGGNLILILVLTGLVSLILGLGLPTTANYIVVSALMAPVIQTLAAQNGLIIPLIAVHLFVFYFGIMADVTPPVGLASFAAAAVSGADPIRTGFTAFYYSLRTVALPFVFVFNTELLLIGVDNIYELTLIIISSIMAMLIFAAGTQGYFITRSKFYESIMLLLVAFTMFRPGFWMDYYQPEFDKVSASQLFEIAEKAEKDASIRMIVEGINIQGDVKRTTLLVPLGEKLDSKGKALTGEERLRNFGVILSPKGEKLAVDYAENQAQKMGLDFGWDIVTLELPADRPPKELFYIPAILLLLSVVYLQRRRRDDEMETVDV